MSNKDRVQQFKDVDNSWILRAFIIAFFDVCAIFISYFVALWMRYDFIISRIPSGYIDGYRTLTWMYAVIAVTVFYMFRLYHSIWRFASVNELARMVIANIVLAVLIVLISELCNIRMPVSFYLVGFMLSFIITTGVRFSYRFLRAARDMLLQKKHRYGNERVMIIGAGSAGKIIIHELIMSRHLDSKVCCVIDDNPIKMGRMLDGVPIVGNRYDIPDMVKKYKITKIIYAIPSTNHVTKKDIFNICKETGCKIMTVPGVYQLLDGDVSVASLREVQVEDLLGREPAIVDNKGIHSFINGKVVMVTGAGGSIGSELCRQIAKEKPGLLIMFDIYENNAYDIQQELKRELPDVAIATLIGSVRNTNRVNSILEQYHPEIIYHAAAHKHVPLMEDSPNEAIKNNVFGTYKLAQAAVNYGVKRFVLISTDKAVNPTNIMGASKRICEMIVQMMNRKGKTEFVAVRFGNVLGSNGSVVPLFKKQIEEGGPVTVTDPNIVRYFMTIPEAVALVIQASIYAKGGEIFVLDMGEPVKIDDLARNLIKLSGYEPDVDIKIEYTGLRPGEKLYEEMLMMEEGLQSTPNHKIHIGKPIEMSDENFVKQLDALEEACTHESTRIKRMVAEIVPTYHIRQ